MIAVYLALRFVGDFVGVVAVGAEFQEWGQSKYFLVNRSEFLSDRNFHASDIREQFGWVTAQSH